MCDAIMGATLMTLPGLGSVSVGTALAVGGTAFSVMGALQSGANAQKVGEYNATVAQQKAQADEATQRRRTNALLSTARANVGASGIELSGSPLDVIANSAAEAELDALNIRYGGQITAQRERLQGSVARSQSYTAAASSLLQGLSSASRAGRKTTTPDTGGGGSSPGAADWLLAPAGVGYE